MAFHFEAALVIPDAENQSLSFADRREDHVHYLIIQRDQESPDAVLPDAENLYVERDDQQFGGYGGIECVTLSRHRLSLKLTPRMARKMGHHDTLSVGFAEADDSFGRIDQLVELIFRGYESRVERLP
jgi:hypothetical protein